MSWRRSTVEYSKQTREMPDWDDLIVRCIANDLINERMMGNQHGPGRDTACVTAIWLQWGEGVEWGLGDW